MSLTREILTVEEVAAILRKSPRTVRRRKIDYFKEGATRLYDRRDVDAYFGVNEDSMCSPSGFCKGFNGVE